MDSIKKLGNQFVIDAERECTICLESFQQDQELVQLDCSSSVPHLFHFECLNNWIEGGGNACPLCREPIKTT